MQEFSGEKETERRFRQGKIFYFSSTGYARYYPRGFPQGADFSIELPKSL